MFNMVCMWLGSLDMRQRSSANSMWGTKEFGKRAFYPVCNAINVIQVDAGQQRVKVYTS